MPYASDAALANKLASLDRKDFKVSVAEDPDAVSKALDIERYVESTSWGKAVIDLLTLNFPLACETSKWIESTTGDKREASYAWLRTFSLTSPLTEYAEAIKSGDPSRIGRSMAQAALTYTMLYSLINGAWDVAKGKGLAVGVAKAAYDLIVPAQGLYAILKGGLSGIEGALSDISDVGLKSYLEGAWVDLKARLTGYEYIPFIPSDENLLDSDITNGFTFDSYELTKVPVGWMPEEPCIWTRILDDASIAKKISSESWVRSFIKEIDDYQKLDQIGEGETEILGLKIKMEKGIVGSGDPDSLGKIYFDLDIIDTGSTIRVYEDNKVSVWHRERFVRLKTEQLEAVGANIEPIETDGGTRTDGRTNPGTDLTTIFMRDYLKKIGFFDKFVIGQETEKLFGAKGTIKAKGESNDGPYVTIVYKADTGKGSGVKEVRISPDGATVNGYLIVDVEASEDGAVYLYYKHGDHVSRTPIKLPPIMIKGTLIETKNLFFMMDSNDIQKYILLMKDKDPTFSLDLEALDMRSSEDFTRTVAYAVNVATQGDFKAKYGQEQYNALIKLANFISKSETDISFKEFGLDVQTDVKAGVMPGEPGEDILGKTKDGIILKVDIEFAGAGKDCYNDQVYKLQKKFTEGKADLGIIFWEGERHVFINSATKYEPLANIAKGITRAGSRSLKDFAGVSTIIGLGLLSGYMTGTKGEAVSVTDNTGRWIGDFQDSYLDHTAVDRSTVYNCSLSLTSVDDSYLQKVRSTASTIIGSAITSCNVSAKLIYDSILQNTLAVCSTIVNSVIDLCRILNSTLVSVVNLVGSHVEDSSIAYSANISNCTVMNSTLMSVLNLSNTIITGSNLTLVANVYSSRIERSNISYSANISKSEIINTKLVGSTVQGSRLTSCTAVDSNLRNVNATNANLTSTNVEDSNLINVNATNSKLTKANVEYSNLENVELKNVEVYGTNIKDVKVADKTVVYGRVINSNGDLDPVHRVGTPNYSGKEAKRFEQTNIEFHGETAPSSTNKTSSHGSTSSGTKTKSNVTTSSKASSSSGQSQTTETSNQTTSNQSIPSQEEKPIRRGSNVWIN
jgi:uncharacterized protein YjbI with pentapeptide repeats